MALWGKSDDIYSPGTVAVNYGAKTITGTGSSFGAAKVGDVISIGAGKTYGEAVISAITSQTLISIASTQFLNGEAISGQNYTISQKPKYTLHDSNYGANDIYGADGNIEVPANSGTQYALTHAGWVGIKTYVDASGALRVKTETLVAMSGISTGTASYAAAGDAADDTVLQDLKIVISAQPSSQTVGVGTTATFSVTAATSPAGGSLTYQWQRSTNSGSTYSNIGGATSSTVSIANTNTANNGYYYRVRIASTGARNVFSTGARLGVTTN